MSLAGTVSFTFRHFRFAGEFSELGGERGLTFPIHLLINYQRDQRWCEVCHWLYLPKYDLLVSIHCVFIDCFVIFQTLNSLLNIDHIEGKSAEDIAFVSSFSWLIAVNCSLISIGGEKWSETWFSCYDGVDWCISLNPLYSTQEVCTVSVWSCHIVCIFRFKLFPQVTC